MSSRLSYLEPQEGADRRTVSGYPPPSTGALPPYKLVQPPGADRPKVHHFLEHQRPLGGVCGEYPLLSLRDRVPTSLGVPTPHRSSGPSTKGYSTSLRPKVWTVGSHTLRDSGSGRPGRRTGTRPRRYDPSRPDSLLRLQDRERPDPREGRHTLSLLPTSGYASEVTLDMVEWVCFTAGPWSGLRIPVYRHMGGDSESVPL